MSDVFKGDVPRACLLLLLIAVSEGLTSPAVAESGSAQTTISLVVPPNDSDAMSGPFATKATDVAIGRPVYIADTRASVLQHAGNVIFRVWMSL
jgi:hypothetical protein